MLEQDRTEPRSVGNYRVEYWSSEPEIGSTAYFDYWNNEQIEKLKPWHVLESGFAGLEQHLKKTGLVRQLEQCLDRAAQLGHAVHGVGADLACGVLWTTSLMLKRIGSISKIYSVEYSTHRLLEIGPTVLRHYGVEADKVVLCLGTFYKLRLPDESVDFVILAEAFHHAEEPGRLLAEIRRVLKPSGVVFVIGEHRIPNAAVLYGRNFVKRIGSRILPKMAQRWFFGTMSNSVSLFPSLEELLRPDPIMGDHYYLLRHYKQMFSTHGFGHHRIRTRRCPFQGFVLVPQTSPPNYHKGCG